MLELLIVVALIVLNAFFALSEMALMTSRKLRLKQLAKTRHPSRGARKALALAEHPDNLLSTVQVGITLIGVLTGVFGGDAIGLLIAGWLEGIWPACARVRPRHRHRHRGRPDHRRSGHLRRTDPEAAGADQPGSHRRGGRHSAATACRARPSRSCSLLGAINRLVLRLLGIKDDARSAISEEEIRLLVTESHEQGVIDADERKMMNRVLSLGDRTAESLMTPRMRIAWLDAAAPLEENLATMRESPFSRFPVYRGNDQDVLGILEAKSLLRGLGLGDRACRPTCSPACARRCSCPNRPMR